MSSEVRVGLVWRFAFGVGAIAAPVLAYAVTALLVDGHCSASASGSRSKSSPPAPPRLPT